MQKRTSLWAHVRWLLPAASLALLGCPKQELAPLGPCTVSAVSERVDQTGISSVDLLFVIDNSGSMASEQVKLAKELPRLVGVLTSGDRRYTTENYTPPTDRSDTTRFFTPVKSLHLGVVSSNMGGIDTVPTGSSASITSCQGLGDDGILQTSTDIAADGVTAVRQGEFPGYDLNERVLAPDSSCELGPQPKYQDYVAGEEPTQEEVAASFRCVSRLGVRGCPFEQQLEAMWKALAPSNIEDEELGNFLDGNSGQGEAENKGFLRPEAILAVLHVSDEEDCSITPEGKPLFDQTDIGTAYGPINVRCGRHSDPAEGLVWPTDRYVKGLKSLKPDNPDRIIFGAIVGIPTDAAGQDYDEILDRSDMTFREVGTGANTLPVPSCTGQSVSPDGKPKTDEAYPPRRFLEVAKGFGSQAVIYSICQNDYAPALNLVIEKIASKLKGNCLPRRLNPSPEGLVACEVYELLPPSQTSCTSDRGHVGDPVVRTVKTTGGKTEKRNACLMSQIPVRQSMVLAGLGWYYDDFSEDLGACPAGEQQRISFLFENGETDLPEGAGAIFECFQPVARIDTSAKGFDAVNSPCDEDRDGNPDQAVCDAKSNKDEGGYDLICIEGLNTCQVECAADPDCPPGWVCAEGADNTAGPPKYCQLPTCPQTNAGSES